MLETAPASRDPNDSGLENHPKVLEYRERIINGEDPETITQGLPEAIKQAVLKESEAETLIPTRYQGLPAEVLEDIWNLPVYLDPEKNRREQENRERALTQLRHQERELEIATENKNIKQAEDASRIAKIRTDLGATKSKEVDPQISPETIEDFESLSVEDFAIKLVALARDQKKYVEGTYAYDTLTSRPEFRNMRVAEALGNSSELVNVYGANLELIKKYHADSWDNMASVEGTKRVTDGWDHYVINEPERERQERHKGYITLNKDQVLAGLNAMVKMEIAKRLRDEGYHGQVKFPTTGSRALFAYDNIVLHGDQEEDVGKGIEIIQKVLSEHALDYSEPRRGVDAEGIDGKKTSYTDRIAQIVERATKDSSIDIEQEIRALKS